MNATLKPATAHTAQSLAQTLRAMGKPKLAHEASQIGYRMTELEAFVREAVMNCSIDNHGGGEDLDCEFCAKGGALLIKEKTS